MADVKGLVNDPAFQSLSPTDQRAALAGVTGDKSFASLGDDETKQFVSHFRSPMPTPDAQISAAPKGVLPWLNSAENDLRYGTKNTGLGEVLSFLGAKGINRGVSEGAANSAITGPVRGPIEVAQGVASMGQHPLKGALAAAGGLLDTAGPFLGMGAPEVAEGASAIPGAVKSVAKGTAELATDSNNILARMLRYPASARQSQLGRPGTIKNILPSFLQKYTIPESVIPKGDIGTVTNPGPYAEIPIKVPKATQAFDPVSGEISPDAAPLRPTVGSPEDFQVYDQRMKNLKAEASDAGTYSAARGKVGKKLNYQQRIVKKINP